MRGRMSTGMEIGEKEERERERENDAGKERERGGRGVGGRKSEKQRGWV